MDQVELGVEEDDGHGHRPAAVEAVGADGFLDGRHGVEGDVVLVAGAGNVDEEEVARLLGRAGHVLGGGVELVGAEGQLGVGVVAVGVLVVLGGGLDLLTQVALVGLAARLELEEGVHEGLAVFAAGDAVRVGVVLGALGVGVDDGDGGVLVSRRRDPGASGSRPRGRTPSCRWPGSA